jgi:hypothetical protein
MKPFDQRYVVLSKPYNAGPAYVDPRAIDVVEALDPNYTPEVNARRTGPRAKTLIHVRSGKVFVTETADEVRLRIKELTDDPEADGVSA